MYLFERISVWIGVAVVACGSADPVPASNPPVPATKRLSDASVAAVDAGPSLPAVAPRPPPRTPQAAYRAQCDAAFSRLSSCFPNPAFVRALRQEWRAQEDVDQLFARLSELVATPTRVTQRCDAITAERFTLPHAPSYQGRWAPDRLRALLAVPNGDCATLATQLLAIELIPGE